MKTREIILSLVLILVIITPVNCQLNWAPPGSIWYYDALEGLEPPVTGYLMIESIGDTVVNDTEMSVLKLSRFYVSGNIQTESIELTYEKDSIIYIWKWGQPNVLYDFTKKPGEYHSVIGHGPNDCGKDSLGSVIVDSVGIEMVNGFESSYYYSSPTDSSIWQLSWKTNSRYGNLFFLFASPSECNIADFSSYAGPIRCYYDNDIGWIHFTHMPCDTLIILNLETPSGATDIQIYPNPISNYIIVKSNTYHEGKPCRYKIINSQGQELDNGILLGFNTKIMLDNIPPGVFYFQIIRPGTNYQESFKMLKIIR
ncbi:MAG: T9SS type A sorting domain-containing protein [Bacteroidales bacterium]|nr:T9SS type A sorting domain-containing protein [Bacteroidales bacterium]